MFQQNMFAQRVVIRARGRLQCVGAPKSSKVSSLMVNFSWLGLSAPQPTEVDRQTGQIAKPHIFVDQHVSKLSEKSAVGVCLTLEWVGAAIVKKIEKKVKEAFALFQVCCTAHKPSTKAGPGWKIFWLLQQILHFLYLPISLATKKLITFL